MSASFDLPTPPVAATGATAGRAHAHLLRTAAARLDSLVLAGGAIVATVALLSSIGADARWVAALGAWIVEQRSVPDFIPYATAASEAWPNVPVVAELVFHSVWRAFGEAGLALMHVLFVSVAVWLLAVDMRRGGATRGAAALVLLVLAVGAAPSLVVVRLQTFSLLLFPLLLLLLRAETRSPSRRVWLLVPLLALWSNLHGAALVGLAVVGAYLVCERLRRDPLQSLALGVAAAGALCLTPALERTPDYYLGVLGNEAAARGAGMWASLSPTSPFHVALAVAAITLGVFAVRSRPPAWELVAMAGLAVMTLQTARSGVWLLMLAAVPAARALPISRGDVRLRVALPLAALLALVTGFALARGPAGADTHAVVEAALVEARGTPILAGATLAEQVALAGGRVWVGNPIDAFRPADQRLYLDWLEGDPAGDRALAHARAVLVYAGDPADDRLRRNRAFTAVRRTDAAVLYVRASARGAADG